MCNYSIWKVSNVYMTRDTLWKLMKNEIVKKKLKIIYKINPMCVCLYVYLGAQMNV